MGWDSKREKDVQSGAVAHGRPGAYLFLWAVNNGIDEKGRSHTDICGKFYDGLRPGVVEGWNNT